MSLLMETLLSNREIVDNIDKVDVMIGINKTSQRNKEVFMTSIDIVLIISPKVCNLPVHTTWEILDTIIIIYSVDQSRLIYKGYFELVKQLTVQKNLISDL